MPSIASLVLASIPSPAHGVLHVGPVPIHAYGLMLALGVIAAVRIAERRYERAGHDPAVIGEIAIAVVVAGVIGARVYHLFTGYDWERDGIVGTVEIWHGGLGIWGAVAGGALAVVVVARRRHLDVFTLLDAIAPGVVVAQAIGRWGNWFNQELFGRPTHLPWGLRIDPQHRPPQYMGQETFHPTFLYESLWCLLVYGVIVWSERRFRFRSGQTFTLYIALYTFGRFWFELMRVDPASRLLGMRFNALLSAVISIGAWAWFALLARRSAPSTGEEADEAALTP